MVTFSLLTITSLALCLAPAVALFMRAQTAAAGADAYGWALSGARAAGLWYGVALTAVGTLTTVFLYWPLTILYVIAGAVVIGLSRRLAPSVPESLAAMLPGTRPELSPAADPERRHRDRRLSVAAAVIALLFAGLFAFTAATIASEELPGGHAGDRSPKEVAAALIRAAALNAALFGTAPDGSPAAGTQVAIVKMANPGTSGVEYRIMTRAPDGTAWSSLEGAQAYDAPEDAIAAVTERYGIETFSLWLTDSGEGPPAALPTE